MNTENLHGKEIGELENEEHGITKAYAKKINGDWVYTIVTVSHRIQSIKYILKNGKVYYGNNAIQSQNK